MTSPVKEAAFQKLIGSGKLTLACFSAAWCAPCQTMKPILQKIASEFSDTVTVVQIDVDQNMDLTVSWQIMGVPSLLLFRNGNLLWRYSDVIKHSELESTITSFL